jgi:nucleoside phosphorylase
MENDPHVDVLLVTVTKVETTAVLAAFGALERSKPLSIEGRVYFDLGIVNGTRVGLTRSEMGAGGLGASLHTVDKGIEALSPVAVIMVGIAFGIDAQKQHIGDVLVAAQLRPYELQRVGTRPDGSVDIVLRDERPHASPGLLNWLKSAELAFRGPTLRFGTILTGSKLVDHIDFRERLRAQEPTAIGGEMEGAGLYVACHHAKVDWIMVKAICDFADGQKGKHEEERQALAAKNAAAFVHHALSFVRVDWTEIHHPQPARKKRPKGRRWMRTSAVALGVLLMMSGIGLARLRVKQAPIAPGYPLTHTKPIAADCTKPAIILATTFMSNGAAYPWPVTHQTFRANRQFVIVPREPKHEREVFLAPYQYDDNAYALVATCYDAATCNEVAAMYKAIVRSSDPQLFCGKSSHLGATPVGTFSWNPDFHANMPEPTDTRALCARLNACMIATDRSVEGDPFVECQRAPQTFKTSCAMRDPCEEVLNCVEPFTAFLRSWGLAR